MPIIHVYDLEFRYKAGRSIANMRLEAANKKAAKETDQRIAEAMSPILADHYEKWIGYRREHGIEVTVAREPDKHL